MINRFSISNNSVELASGQVLAVKTIFQYQYQSFFFSNNFKKLERRLHFELLCLISPPDPKKITDTAN